MLRGLRSFSWPPRGSQRIPFPTRPHYLSLQIVLHSWSVVFCAFVSCSEEPPPRTPPEEIPGGEEPSVRHGLGPAGLPKMNSYFSHSLSWQVVDYSESPSTRHLRGGQVRGKPERRRGDEVQGGKRGEGRERKRPGGRSPAYAAQARGRAREPVSAPAVQPLCRARPPVSAGGTGP